MNWHIFTRYIQLLSLEGGLVAKSPDFAFRFINSCSTTSGVRSFPPIKFLLQLDIVLADKRDSLSMPTGLIDV